VSEWVSQSGCQSASQFSSASQRANQPTSQSSSSASQHISRLRTRHGHETGETYLWQSSEEQLMHVPVADTACLPSSTHSMHVAGSLGASPDTSTWARVVASSNPSPGIHSAHSTCAHTEAQDGKRRATGTCCEFQFTCRRWRTVYAHALAQAQAHSHTHTRKPIHTHASTFTHTQAHSHTRKHIHTRAHEHAHAHAHAHAHEHACSRGGVEERE
jgi:hypothetical protein